VPLSPIPKDPDKVRAGQAGAVVRWAGNPDRRIVKLESLSPEARNLVLALVDAARTSKAKAP
jgi:hypothetical protein